MNYTEQLAITVAQLRTGDTVLLTRERTVESIELDPWSPQTRRRIYWTDGEVQYLDATATVDVIRTY